jgi:DEAD/DEAH box helicase domain-containing protein
LKKRFGGKVDHLRVVTQEEKKPDEATSRQYVLLYDSVPGGTGYLHQLLTDEAKTLVEVFRLALSHLTSCSCNADPGKDGCYGCVYQYRLGRAMDLVSRDRARAILEQLVGKLDELERVASISDIYINPNFDSELESRFIESLRRLSGEAGLPFVKLVQELVHGKSGYLLEVDQQRYWIEPQVDLGPSEGIEVYCRPDFVLWPAQSKSPRRSIAVFCDGWTHHQASTREDARKRSALVASGRFWVCSVAWDDVQSAMDGQVDTTLPDCLEVMCFNSKEKLPLALRSLIDDGLWTRHAIAVLIEWLGKPAGEVEDHHAMKVVRHAGATAFRMLPNPGDATLDQARATLAQFWNELKDWPCERPAQSAACGNVNDLAVSLRYWWPNRLINTAKPIPLSPGFVIYNESHAHDEPARHLAWRRWLWLFNIFQTLPGVLMATQTGLESKDYASLTIVTGVPPGTGAQIKAQAAGWEQVIEQAMSDLKPGLRALMEAGVPPPDEVGYELAEAGSVIAEAELVWIQRKLALLMAAHVEFQAVLEAHGWKTVVAQGEWQQRLMVELTSRGAQ